MPFNPVLQAPNLNAASRVSPGVEDTSGSQMQGVYASMAKTLGTLATEGYKTYTEEGINVDTQSVIKEYMESKKNPETAYLAAANLARVDKEIESVFTTPGGTVEQVSALEKEYKTYNDKMVSALNQGVMSPSVFSDKVLAKLREHVNKNPGLYPELSREAQRVLELSGITSVIKADELALKGRQEQADWAMKDTAARLKAADIPYDPTTIQENLPRLLGELAKVESDTNLFAAQQRGETRRKISVEAQARQYHDDGLRLVNGGLTSFSTSTQALIETLDTANIPKALSQIALSGEQMKVQFKRAIPSNIIMEPAVQSTIEMFNKGIDGIVERTKLGATKEQLATIVQNEVAILKAGQDKNLRETVDVSSLEMSSQIARNLPGFVQGQIATNMTNAALALSTGQYNAKALTDIMASNRPKLGEFMLSGSKIGLDTGDYTALKRSVQTLNTSLSTTNLTPASKEDSIYQSAIGISKNALKGLDTEGIQGIKGMIGMSMNGPYGVKTMLELAKQNKTNIDALPDGRLVFTGPMAPEMTAKFGVRMNTYLQAYSNAHNMSTEKAAKLFYRDYFSRHIVGSPLESDKDIK